MVRRTREAAAATREQLLDAAERVFRDRGVTRTSLAEVAAEAGVTRGALWVGLQPDAFRDPIQPVTGSRSRRDAARGTCGARGGLATRPAMNVSTSAGAQARRSKDDGSSVHPCMRPVRYA